MGTSWPIVYVRSEEERERVKRKRRNVRVRVVTEDGMCGLVPRRERERGREWKPPKPKVTEEEMRVKRLLYEVFGTYRVSEEEKEEFLRVLREVTEEEERDESEGKEESEVLN